MIAHQSFFSCQTLEMKIHDMIFTNIFKTTDSEQMIRIFPWTELVWQGKRYKVVLRSLADREKFLWNYSAKIKERNQNRKIPFNLWFVWYPAFYCERAGKHMWEDFKKSS